MKFSPVFDQSTWDSAKILQYMLDKTKVPFHMIPNSPETFCVNLKVKVKAYYKVFLVNEVTKGSISFSEEVFSLIVTKSDTHKWINDRKISNNKDLFKQYSIKTNVIERTQKAWGSLNAGPTACGHFRSISGFIGCRNFQFQKFWWHQKIRHEISGRALRNILTKDPILWSKSAIQSPLSVNWQIK